MNSTAASNTIWTPALTNALRKDRKRCSVLIILKKIKLATAIARPAAGMLYSVIPLPYRSTPERTL